MCDFWWWKDVVHLCEVCLYRVLFVEGLSCLKLFGVRIERDWGLRLILYCFSVVSMCVVYWLVFCGV